MASAVGGGSPGLQHLVLVGLFMSADLPPQILDVALEGADQPQQALPLLLQVVDVGASVIQLFLHTVQLLSPKTRQGVTSEDHGQKTQPRTDVSIDTLRPSSPRKSTSYVGDLMTLSSHFVS